MKEIITKVYKFDELSETAKEKVRDWFRQGNDGSFEWENILDDAKTIGLEVHSLDQHRRNEGEFIRGAVECAEKILKEHGESCATYQTAKNYLEDRNKLALDEDGEFIDVDNADELTEEFLHDLLEDYRIMLEKDIEYQNADEQIDENIRLNEYDFEEDGRRARI
jgi:hypothetical protein